MRYLRDLFRCTSNDVTCTPAEGSTPPHTTSREGGGGDKHEKSAKTTNTSQKVGPLNLPGPHFLSLSLSVSKAVRCGPSMTSVSFIATSF